MRRKLLDVVLESLPVFGTVIGAPPAILTGQIGICVGSASLKPSASVTLLLV